MMDADNQFSDLLEPGERLMWQGPLGFNVTSSPVLSVMLVLFALYTVVGMWLMQGPADFCADAPADSPCTTLYWATPAATLVLAAMQVFDMLERRAILSGRAKGTALLTDRRLIRISDWPSRRVRSHNYRTRIPRKGFGGVLRFGALGGTVILSAEDARRVRQMMMFPGQVAP